MNTTVTPTAPTSAAATSATDQLAAWQSREAEVRARLMDPGLSRLDQLQGKTGLEVFQAMLAGELPPPPISRTLDYLIVEAERGRVVFQGRPLFRHYNPLGTVHGGWIATLLDSAVACAVHSTLPLGKTYTTVELKLNYVKALTEKVPLVRAEGRVIHTGNRMGTAEGRLTGPDGTLYAHASTTCFILDLPAQATPR
ncbi:PaaI family thioesterase [Caldimonas brevitalea]|uniref:Aromatic compound catabolic protein n=1 Tax=Caldimonas brevitalea TaxID=413882 RepID=A0A0G3BFQ1_9BURK|nr:PaaI family thioesterase [Caldimonas brevitalea]AKJ28157.1 aromatic compound catabolic protein [Caldimonas brevitalea]